MIGCDVPGNKLPTNSDKTIDVKTLKLK